MSTWGTVLVVVAVVLVGTALVLLRGGKDGRVARRELRRLRWAEKRVPDTHAAAEQRRNMNMDAMPGSRNIPGGP